MAQLPDTTPPNEADGRQPKRLLYPISEVRSQLGDISHTYFYEIVKRGELELVKMGRRSFVTDDALRAYVARLSRREAT